MSESIFYDFFLYRTVQKKIQHCGCEYRELYDLAAVTSRENPLLDGFSIELSESLS